MATKTAPKAAAASRVPYLLLFRNSGAENYRDLSADNRQRVVEKWNAWFEGLVAQGKALEGQPLGDETRVVSGPGGSRVTDGPFSEAKEVVGGFVRLLVANREEATAIAQRHPGLEHGLIIEVRPLSPDCHLGVNTGTKDSASGEMVLNRKSKPAAAPRRNATKPAAKAKVNAKRVARMGARR